MKRMTAVLVVVVLLAIGAWRLGSRDSRDPVRADAAVVPSAASAASEAPAAAPAAPDVAVEVPVTAPTVLPTIAPAEIAKAKEFLAQRQAILREFDAALRFGDPFPFVPVLELMAQHGDSRGARGLYEILRDCADPKRKGAEALAAEHVERAARNREVRGPTARRDDPEAEASRIALEVAHARAMDVGCAKVQRADADAAWARFVALAQKGNRAARYAVALELAARRDEMIANGRLVPGSELERAAAQWLLDAALRGRSAQRIMLTNAYCRGGLVPADPVQCYAWEQFGRDNSRFPTPPRAVAYLRELWDALTPLQQALADKRIAELRACCSRPRY